MGFLVWLNVILASILLFFGLNWLFYYYMGKKSATIITEEEFKEGMRRAQVIDVREKNEFDAGHILGARNIPYTTFAQSAGGIRKDLPIYLYDNTKTLSVRAANKLRKQGYTNIYILKTGYSDWSGKTKQKKVF
ncbi:MAG TPA: rhodanese-like domain-containing protein [Candidatus Enterococcus avicola]|uniref:Rhodanese-like domain-containing protein n=1 Tax=Candidatus Enterococcus avicola TaxID=2838561 RepID=A0A9D2F8M4_9ENTE|nr:rhodanese-like domain-containing protein [Candidatus Enterococcus avicola]